MGKMTLQQLDYILALDRFRHFGKAAAYCNITQPTLSAMVHKLEEELGVKLFDRNRSPVVPTLIGKKVLAQAARIMAETRRVTDIIREEVAATAGSIHIAVLPTIAPYLLPRFLPAFKEAYPETDIRMVELQTHIALEWLSEGKTDAAILATAVEEEMWVAHTLYYEPFNVYVAAGEPLASREVIRTSDLVNEKDLFLLDEGHCFRDQLYKYCQWDSVKRNQAVYRLGSLETFMRMVEAGTGITFIPELAVLQLDERQKALVRPFAVPRPARRISLVTRKDYIRHSLLERIVENIRDCVPEKLLVPEPGLQVLE